MYTLIGLNKVCMYDILARMLGVSGVSARMLRACYEDDTRNFFCHGI